MPDFRLYILAGDRIADLVDVRGATQTEALEQAMIVAGQGCAVEVWHRDRILVRLPPGCCGKDSTGIARPPAPTGRLGRGPAGAPPT